VPAALTSVAVHCEEAHTVNCCEAESPITSGCEFTYAIAGGSTYTPACGTCRVSISLLAERVFDNMVALVMLSYR
jgi:hypothetical protein